MACTCVTCNTSYSGSCCPTCQPANSIYQGECSDPGTLTIGRHLSVLDYKFCERRLTNAPGFLTATVNGSGNYSIGFTTTPQVALGEVVAVEDAAFGNIIVMGSDSRWRYLTPPAGSGLFLQTDGANNVIFGAPPAATVPDPLAITDLNVADTAIINNLVTNGTVTLNNIVNGTVVNLVGLNASNQLVLQALAAGLAGCMFYESNSSPGSGAPNETKTNGQFLVIGNRLFDSGGDLISVSTSESLTVNKAGKYVIFWVSQHQTSGAARPNVGSWLQINGVIVNWANGRTSFDGGDASTPQLFHITGIEMRELAAGDVLQLQLSETATSIKTFEVRLVAFKFAD